VVDDDHDLVTAVVDALCRTGHVVAAAETGADAISLAAEFEPDVALLDVFLPDINGITLAALLRGVVERKPLRVIGLSGAGIERLQEASERGIFDEYLAKPLSLAALEAALLRHR
jgi:CheY-like chemotaxis protein